jgi:hypothetical protein
VSPQEVIEDSQIKVKYALEIPLSRIYMKTTQTYWSHWSKSTLDTPELYLGLINNIQIFFLIVEECILLRLYTIKYDNHVTSLATIYSNNSNNQTVIVH